MRYFFSLAKKGLRYLKSLLASRQGSAAYWTVHMVSHDEWKSSQESLEYFHWRNDQYPGYIDLMPVSGQDGKVVLDYGCGPGNDVIGFCEFSKPEQLIAVDVSKSALAKAEQRLRLHGKEADFILIDEVTNKINVPAESVDYIHSSGVLHHCANLGSALEELHRILKPGGTMAVMVYNYNSIWYHLYVAWYHQINQKNYRNLATKDAFRRLTDGPNCPIADCYTPEEFISIVESKGFRGTFKGASMSLKEMGLLNRRFEAIADRNLNSENRNFLTSLTFNEFGFPLYKGNVAGINACFSFTKRG